MPQAQPLLILDLDETLIRGTRERLEQEPMLELPPYFVYARPHAQSFLAQMGRSFSLGIWSSANMAYVGPIARQLWGNLPEPLFVWGRQECRQRFDFQKKEIYYQKDLRQIARRGLSLERVLIVDDDFTKISLQYGNAILVEPFYGDEADRELLDLALFLEEIKDSDNFQKVRKEFWKSRHVP
jgi:RNA polymerase II subunit A small phosphatase-like protein